MPSTYVPKNLTYEDLLWVARNLSNGKHIIGVQIAKQQVFHYYLLKPNRFRSHKDIYDEPATTTFDEKCKCESTLYIS